MTQTTEIDLASDKRIGATVGSTSRDEFMPQTCSFVLVAPDGSLMSEKHFVSFPSAVVREAPDVFVGQVLALPGCVSQGKTYEEATVSLREALEAVLALHKAVGTMPQYAHPAAEEIPARADVFDLHLPADGGAT